MADTVYSLTKVVSDSIQTHVTLDSESLKMFVRTMSVPSTFPIKEILAAFAVIIVAVFSAYISIRLSNRQFRFSIFTEWSINLRNSTGRLLSTLYMLINDTVAYDDKRGVTPPKLKFTEEELTLDKLHQNYRDSEAEFLNAMLQVRLLLNVGEKHINDLVDQCDKLRNNINYREDGLPWTTVYSQLTSNFLVAINGMIDTKRQQLRVPNK